MKKLIIKSALVILLFNLISCESVLDEIHKDEAEQNYVSPFRGKYIGNYSGDLNGSLTVNVSDKGSVEVIRSTLNSQEVYYTGLINSSFNTTIKSATGFMLIGNLNSLNGTWEMGSSKGSWTLKKN